LKNGGKKECRIRTEDKKENNIIVVPHDPVDKAQRDCLPPALMLSTWSSIKITGKERDIDPTPRSCTFS
jgi:hypothetical protein